MNETIDHPIDRLELEIEQASQTIEWCRKFMVISQLFIGTGATSLVAMLAGLLPTTAMTLILAITACLVGIVGYGTNASTRNQAVGRRTAAEAMRLRLIDRLAFKEFATITDGTFPGCQSVVLRSSCSLALTSLPGPRPE